MASQFSVRDDFRPGVKSDAGSDELFNIENGSFLEHEIDATCDFISENGIAFKLSVFGNELVGIDPDERVAAPGDDRNLPEGPSQIGITHLSARKTFNFSGTGNRSLDESAVTDEILNGGESLNGVDFEKNRQG